MSRQHKIEVKSEVVNPSLASTGSIKLKFVDFMSPTLIDFKLQEFVRDDKFEICLSDGLVEVKDKQKMQTHWVPLSNVKVMMKAS